MKPPPPLNWVRRTPRWVAALVLTYAALLAGVGASTHLADLVCCGLYRYGWAPGWLNLYWASLVLADFAAALLLLYGRRTGLYLACVVLSTDLAANAYAVYALRHSSVATQPGLQRVAAGTVLLLGTAPAVRSRLPTGARWTRCAARPESSALGEPPTSGDVRNTL